MFDGVPRYEASLAGSCEGAVDCQVLAEAYQGAKGGWQQFFAALERVLARMIGDWYLRKLERQPNEVQTI
jgi:hypothetical protein